MLSQLKDCCGQGNALCVHWFIWNQFNGQTKEMIVCGGVDKQLRGYENISRELLFSYALPAPILAIDSFEHFIACSLMDGKHCVVSVGNDINALLIEVMLTD